MTRHPLVSRRGLALAASASVALWLHAGAAAAQAIERNLPPAPVASAPAIAEPNITPNSANAAPIGPALSGLVVLGNTDAPVTAPVSGVDVSRVARLHGDVRGLSRFLGQPISRKLIADIEAEIAIAYRRQGYPFVSLSTPPQALTAGVLQVRVTEFTLGTKTTPGAKAKDAGYILSRVRVEPGQEIDTTLLGQDLDWLDRFPFRNTQAVFSPSATPGETDLRLQTTYSKPWSVYVGYANSGSPLTGFDRYFAGAQTVLPFLHDAIVSYQFTGSGNTIFNDSTIAAAEIPTYLSHAGRLVIPTLPRQDVEATVDFVQTFEPTGQKDLDTRLDTLEATLAYRAALSDVWTFLPGEGLLGVETKRVTSEAYLGYDPSGAQHGFDVFQVLLGWAYQGNDILGRTSADLNLHLAPGGADDRNTVAAFETYSSGRFDVPQYAYVSGDLTRFTRIPPFEGLSGFALVNTLIGQYSAVPLPLTEQAGLGGQTLVRGYTLDDGAFDSSLVSRNELHTPTLPLGIPNSVASPYAFFDIGLGKNEATKQQSYPTSTGVAVDLQIGPHIAASFDVAIALRNAGFTQTDNARFDSRITVTF